MMSEEIDYQARFRETHRVTQEAIARVDLNANEQWKRLALEAIKSCAEEQDEFTADEVWARLEGVNVSTHEPAALGPLFKKAASNGWISNSKRHRKRSLYSQRHRELTIWASRLRGATQDADPLRLAAADACSMMEKMYAWMQANEPERVELAGWQLVKTHAETLRKVL